MGLFKKASKSSAWAAVLIQGDSVIVARIKRVTGSKPSVEFAKTFPVDAPLQPDALAKLAKECRLETFQCTTMLGGSEYQLLSVDAPNVPPEELRSAVRFRLKDMLDFSADDATIDVLEVPVDANAPVRNKSMYVVAARNPIIEARQKLFSTAKVGLTAIDIPEMAQRNVAALVEPEGRGLAFLHFDADGGIMTVTFKGELFLSRRLDITLTQLQGGSEDQRKNNFDRITLELQRSLDHFDRQYHFITLAKMVLGPMGEVAQGLKDYLASNLYVPVEMLDLSEAFDFTGTPKLAIAENQNKFLLALGAALRLEGKAA